METFSALLALCVTGEFPQERPATRSFDGFIDLRLNKPLCNNPKAGDLKRYRAHYYVTVIYRSPPGQFLIIATIITQSISRLFNRQESKIWFIRNFFRFSISFYSTPNLNIITRTPPRMNLIAFPLVYLYAHANCHFINIHSTCIGMNGLPRVYLVSTRPINEVTSTCEMHTIM